MAKKSSIEKNERRRKLTARYQERRTKLRLIAHDEKLTLEERFQAQLKLSKLPRNSSPNRVRNRCELTGRPRGYYRKLKMSRIALRQLGGSGQIPGLVKSSW
jgi:small subunit ribosomal protein S14